MAAGSLPAPGTVYGPCKEGCQHTDCMEIRGMAETDCIYCEIPIGYKRRFYRVDRRPVGSTLPVEYAHMDCHHEHLGV